MRYHIKHFLVNQTGATAIEYALIAGIVSIVIVASLGIISASLNKIFTKVATSMTK